MNIYVKFILITLYMFITYHIIALKYSQSKIFSGRNRISKIFLVTLHLFIVITNIIIYFWFITEDFNPVSYLLSVIGVLIFICGIVIIFWGIYSLRAAVFVPENKLIISGPYKFVRHPMYLGGIIGAFGLAMLAGSLLATIYSFLLAVVLSRISDAEEKDLVMRFGENYLEYKMKVSKLFPYIASKTLYVDKSY